MRHLISRPARSTLPLALGAYALLTAGAERALGLMGGVLLARGLSLCAGGALRATAGAVVRASRLRGNLLTAALMAVAGGAASSALCAFLPIFARIGLWNGVAGALINTSQVFADRMYASRDSSSAAAYDLIIAALATVGLLISGDSPWLISALAGCGVLAGGILLAGLKTGSSLQKGRAILKFVPSAMLRGWLFQSLLLACMHISATPALCAAVGLTGIAVIEWCEPAYRRNSAESAACGAALPVISAFWTVLCVLWARREGALPEYFSMARFAEPTLLLLSGGCVCAMLTGLHMNVRRIAAMLFGALSMAGAIIFITEGREILCWLSILASAAGVLTALPDMRELWRTARLRRLMRKRAKRK